MSRPFRQRILLSAAAAGILLAACGDTSVGTTPGATPDTASSMADDDPTTDDAMADDPETDDAATDGAATDGGDDASDGPATSPQWEHPVLTATATRADGSTFRVADHAGSTVFVETFATWCSNCRSQLRDTNAAAAQAPGDVAFLVLSIESGLDPAKLAEYAERNGFDNLEFGVLDDAGLVALDEEFGRTALNAPATPKFLVRPDGTIGELQTGPESVEEILAQIS